MKSYLKNYRQSPRKVRLVANYIKSKKVDEALISLNFIPKRASRVISKVLKSAVQNAEHNFKVSRENLIIQDCLVDEGKTLKRWRARAQGKTGRILKRTSNITIRLVDISQK